MSLSQTHREYITEQLMLDYLHSGTIPTADELEDDLEAYQLLHPNLAEPTSMSEDFDVVRGGESSASLMYTIADTISQDVGIITREMYRIVNENSKFYDRWSNEMRRLSGYARKLEQRTDSLLLLNQDTAGFFASVGDVFADMNQVDTDETTARVDLRETSVYIDPDFSSLMGGAMIDLSHMTENNVSFIPLTKKPGIAYFATGDGNALVNIFKSDNSTWVGKVVTDTSGEMVCELKAKLADEDLEVSKIAAEFTGPLGTTQSTVSCMYSDNGYTWHIVPTSSATQPLATSNVWFFPLTVMRWIKLIFRKAAADNLDNEYIFSMSHLKLHGNTYNDEEGNIFVSDGLSTLNAEGNPVLFSLLALETCEEVPTDTSITYYVSASKDDSTWTNWMLISPAESEQILYPKIINLSGADWKDNGTEDETTKLNTGVASDDRQQKKITREFLNTSIDPQGYRFKDSSYGVVNTAITMTTDEDPDPIGNSVIVWRNVRYRDITDYPDTLTVRDNPRGWGIDGNNYTCYFEIVDSAGKLIDFGPNGCVVDGAHVTGVILVPSGVHKFSTDFSNWHDITDDLVELGTAITTEDELVDLDPLYPYNHKLIIEGFPYATGSAFEGERVYLGTDISAEFYAVRTSVFNLENNIQDNYGYFSVRGVGSDDNPALAVIVKFDTSNSDYTNELFFVKWRSGATDASMYQYVRLKAVFSTEDSGLTPILTSYRIKLGM